MYVDQGILPVLVVLRSQPPLMPYRRRITIRRQSGGGPLHLPRSSATNRPARIAVRSRLVFGEVAVAGAWLRAARMMSVVTSAFPVLVMVGRVGENVAEDSRSRRHAVSLSRVKYALGVPLGLAVSEVASFWLRRAHPHPLGFTAAEPAMPRMLGTHGWEGGLNYMALVYGYPHPRDVSRPLIEVMTCFSAARCYLPSLEEVLTRAELRHAAWLRGDWEEPTGPFDPYPEVRVPASGFYRRDQAVVVDGEQRVIPIVFFRHHDALRFQQDTKIVTAVARFGFPAAPSFHTVDDLGPYAAGFRRFVLSWLRIWET